MTRLYLVGRDTCTGECETEAGCACCRAAQCVTPQACEIAEPEPYSPPPFFRYAIVVAVVAVAAIAAGVVVFHKQGEKNMTKAKKMPVTATATMQVWLSQYQSPNSLLDEDPVRVINACSIYTPHDAKHYGDKDYTLIGEADVTVRFLPETAVVENKVKSLKAQKKSVLAEAQAKATQIETEIQTLLAITFDSTQGEHA